MLRSVLSPIGLIGGGFVLATTLCGCGGSGTALDPSLTSTSSTARVTATGRGLVAAVLEDMDRSEVKSYAGSDAAPDPTPASRASPGSAFDNLEGAGALIFLNSGTQRAIVVRTVRNDPTRTAQPCRVDRGARSLGCTRQPDGSRVLVIAEPRRGAVPGAATVEGWATRPDGSSLLVEVYGTDRPHEAALARTLLDDSRIGWQTTPALEAAGAALSDYGQTYERATVKLDVRTPGR